MIDNRTVKVNEEEYSLSPSVLEPKVISETTDIYTLLAGNLSVGDIVYPVTLTEPMDSEGVVSGTLVTETLSPASLFFDK